MKTKKWIFLALFSFSTGALAATGNSAPMAPSSLTASALSVSQISLKFTDNSNDEQGFIVMRSLNSSSGFSKIATLGSNIVTYTDSSLSASTTYYYRVAAFRKYKGNIVYSTYSNIASAATMAPQPTPSPAPTPTPSPTTDPNWIRCAAEHEICSFSGTRQVRYGLNGNYAYQTATSSIACTNEAFGTDPLVGVVKACDYSSTETTTPAPTPAPAPTPTPEPSPSPITSGSGIGWTELPNTALLSYVPSNASTDLQGSSGPSAIVSAWSGAAADLTRNRMILWGGGHNDYYGNELYALDVGAGKMSRLTNPSPVDALASDPNHCPDRYSDGGPVSRHTYSGLAYMPNADAFFGVGGSKATCGFATGLTWTFQFGSMQWLLRSPAVTPPATFGTVAEYDSNTGLVIVTALGDSGVYAYNPTTSAYTKLSNSASLDYHMHGVIDTARKKMVLMGPSGVAGGGIKEIDLTPGGTYQMTDITSQTSGCDALMTSSPGLAYDSSQGVIVGWPNKGSTVYIFNPDTKTCTAKAFTNGPSETDTGSSWGTFGRFRYFPALDAFALVYNAGKNAYLLKLK